MQGGAHGVQRQWIDDPVALERWKLGLTGVPIVDANMRELRLTGK
jgi:deoxyribodipyrimidine photo-lyase